MAVANTEVKCYRSTDSGAPTLSGEAGKLIGILDGANAGYGQVTLDSLVVASDIATGTLSTGHGFTMVGGTIGPVILIAGATPSSLNGEWRIATVPGSTTFTFVTDGISDQTATGTITAKIAPAGRTKVYSGTNLAAYQCDDVNGLQFFLYVDDTGTTNARFRGYEDMTSISSGTNPFPTDAQQSGGLYCYKSSTASSTTRPWILIVDQHFTYLFIDSIGSGTWVGGLLFGDGNAYKANDAYHCLIVGTTAASGNFYLYIVNGVNGSYLARAYTQIGTSITSGRCTHGRLTQLGAGSDLPTLPSPVDNNAHVWPVEFYDGAGPSRGLVPGLWAPVHNSGMTHGAVISDIANLPNHVLMLQKLNASYYATIDISGSWR